MDKQNIISSTDLPFSRNKVFNRRKTSSVHYHETHYELYCLVNGTTKYFVGDEIFILEKGNIIFIPKGMIHKTDSEECLHNERVLLSFDDSVFNNGNEFLLGELTEKKLCCIPEKYLYKIEEILNLLEKEYSREDQYSKSMQKAYTIQLLNLICRYRNISEPAVSQSDQIVFDVSDFMRKNYDKEISLKMLCKQFSVNESYLSKKFKAVSGTGVTEYITYVRIMNAELLLKQNKYTISEIAYMCGFNDSNYFSTVFKKIKGLSPLKYARKTE